MQNQVDRISSQPSLEKSSKPKNLVYPQRHILSKRQRSQQLDKLSSISSSSSEPITIHIFNFKSYFPQKYKILQHIKLCQEKLQQYPGQMQKELQKLKKLFQDAGTKDLKQKIQNMQDRLKKNLQNDIQLYKNKKLKKMIEKDLLLRFTTKKFQSINLDQIKKFFKDYSNTFVKQICAYKIQYLQNYKISLQKQNKRIVSHLKFRIFQIQSKLKVLPSNDKYSTDLLQVYAKRIKRYQIEQLEKQKEEQINQLEKNRTQQINQLEKNRTQQKQNFKISLIQISKEKQLKIQQLHQNKNLQVQNLQNEQEIAMRKIQNQYESQKKHLTNQINVFVNKLRQLSEQYENEQKNFLQQFYKTTKCQRQNLDKAIDNIINKYQQTKQIIQRQYQRKNQFSFQSQRQRIRRHQQNILQIQRDINHIRLKINKQNQDYRAQIERYQLSQQKDVSFLKHKRLSVNQIIQDLKRQQKQLQNRLYGQKESMNLIRSKIQRIQQEEEFRKICQDRQYAITKQKQNYHTIMSKLKQRKDKLWQSFMNNQMLLRQQIEKLQHKQRQLQIFNTNQLKQTFRIYRQKKSNLSKNDRQRFEQLTRKYREIRQSVQTQYYNNRIIISFQQSKLESREIII